MEGRPLEIASGTYLVEVPFVLGLRSKDKESITLCYLIEEEGRLADGRQRLQRPRLPSTISAASSTSSRISLRQIRWLLLTHYHPDHSGLAHRIRAASGAQVIMHQNDWNVLRATVSSSDIWNIHGMIPWIRALGVPEPELEGFFHIASGGRDLFPRGLEPDVLLQGETNPVGDSGRLQAILTPGHSPGHVCVYDSENRLFFSGDHILVEITPHISPSHLTSEDQLRAVPGVPAQRCGPWT